LFEEERSSEESDCIFFDADGDGDMDLYVSCGGSELSSSSSALADKLYLNSGRGILTRSTQILPAGRYESSSCVEAQDFDGDGDVDLFVGIRMRPFLYGVPANAYLLENDGTGKFTNVSEQRAPGLLELGMITDMVWADMDLDGDPDMLVVGDWMPVKVFINEQGTFKDSSLSWGLAGTEGWWKRVVADDLDGDGDPDLVLGNHGLNSRLRASADKPISMYVNDFDRNGSVEQIICQYFGDTAYPVLMKDDLVKQIPGLAGKYESFQAYSGQTIEDIFPAEILRRSVIQKVHMLESILLINDGTGRFEIRTLPPEGQLFPVFAACTEDFDHDGSCDILLGGNQHRAKPETGIYAAGYGLLLKGKGLGDWQCIPADSGGFSLKGEIRDFSLLNIQGKQVISVARNNENLHFYTF
jgi:hypothetical protein